ncbi:MAG: hypothetical protein ACREQW_16605, partial [Candidatus Binatia bacterium]
LVRRHGEPVERAELNASGWAFKVRRHAFSFLRPNSTESSLASWLNARGPGPYSGTLKGGALPGALDPSLTHGANLSFE